jgi:hypothetical protein
LRYFWVVRINKRFSKVCATSKDEKQGIFENRKMLLIEKSDVFATFLVSFAKSSDKCERAMLKFVKFNENWVQYRRFSYAKVSKKHYDEESNVNERERECINFY